VTNYEVAIWRDLRCGLPRRSQIQLLLNEALILAHDEQVTPQLLVESAIPRLLQPIGVNEDLATHLRSARARKSTSIIVVERKRARAVAITLKTGSLLTRNAGVVDPKGKGLAQASATVRWSKIDI
jgi:hypothetical protein